MKIQINIDCANNTFKPYTEKQEMLRTILLIKTIYFARQRHGSFTNC